MINGRLTGPIKKPGIVVNCKDCGWTTPCWTPFIMNIIRCSICNSKEIEVIGPHRNN